MADEEGPTAPVAVVVEASVGVNCFCRPGELIGQAGIVRVTEDDQAHVLAAGKKVLQAATKGGIRVTEVDRIAADWLRWLNVIGAAAMKTGNAELQQEFDSLCAAMAKKDAPFQVQARDRAAAERQAEKDLAAHEANRSRQGA